MAGGSVHHPSVPSAAVEIGSTVDDNVNSSHVSCPIDVLDEMLRCCKGVRRSCSYERIVGNYALSRDLGIREKLVLVS